MINSNLAIRLESSRPKAIEPIAAQKFLANVNEVSANPDIGQALQRVAIKLASKPVAYDGVEEPHADDDNDVEKMFCMPKTPYITAKGTGIITIEGVIGKNLSMMEKCLGCTDLNDVLSALKAFEKNAQVERVVFKINSGGGTTTGLEETAKYIYNYSKPTISFSDEDMGSAAFWIGSQAKRLIVTPSASIGSCGIYVSVCDNSKNFEKEGKKVVVIKSGDYKGAGVDGTSLTAKQEKWIEGEVLELHTRFIRDVLRSRPLVKVEDLQGQSFYGDVAAARGLATGIVFSFEELIEELEGAPAEIGGVSIETKQQVVRVTKKGPKITTLPYIP